MHKKIIAPIISMLALASFLILPIIGSMHIFNYEVVLILYVVFIVVFFSFIFTGKLNIKPIYIYFLTILLILILRFYDNKFYEVASFFVVPMDFQGNVNVVFGVKGAPAMSFKRHFLYLDQSEDSIICTSTKTSKLPREIDFTYSVDTIASIDDNLSYDFNLKRSFALGYDTLKVNKKVFTYFSVFITKGFHRDTDSVIVKNIQFSNLNKDAIKLVIKNNRKKGFH